MDKVLTINDWWDGPVIGLATYHDAICVYYRVFDIPTDECVDEYFLTPIGDAEVEMIMQEWNEWCTACADKDLGAFYQKYAHNHVIDQVLEKSSEKHKYRKKAKFTGSVKEGWIPVDLCVAWQDVNV